jgi:hypothetical protein
MTLYFFFVGNVSPNVVNYLLSGIFLESPFVKMQNTNNNYSLELISSAALGGIQNMTMGKKGCSLPDLLSVLTKLTDLITNFITLPNNCANNAILVHNTLAPVLSDVEGVEDVEGILENHHLNRLLPLVEFLALFIELFTPYFVEVSSLQDDDGTIFFQIDETNNEFYFAFYDDHLEFAFGNFDEFVSLTWGEIALDLVKEVEPVKGEENIVPSKLKELGTHR